MARRLSLPLLLVIVGLVASPLIVSARAVPHVTTAAVPPPRDAAVLVADLAQLIAGGGATVGVTVVELGGTDQLAWSVDGDAVFTAASTYKLVPLMLEAQT